MSKNPTTNKNDQKIIYRLRPAYGQTELLLEFYFSVENSVFKSELKSALRDLEIAFIKADDLWINDEMLYEINSKKHGNFELSIDSQGIAFILSKGNQNIILVIDKILSENPNFQKEAVDFENYKLNKN